MTEVPYEELPLVPAVCRCGYKGKSKRPQLYRCGFCYYDSWANGLDRKIETLHARIAKLKREAKEHRAKARAFKKRHPEAGGDRTSDPPSRRP